MLEKLSARLTPNVRKVISNALWLFTEKIWQLGLGLLVGIWVARYLGPAQFGALNYAIAIGWIAAPIAKLGLDNLVIRDLAKDPGAKEETLGSAFAMKLISSSITFILVTIAALITNRQDPTIVSLVIILGLAPILQSAEVIDFWFQSQTQAKFSVWARNAAYIFMNVVRVTLVMIKAPVVAFAIAMTIEFGLASLGFVFLYQRQGNLLKMWKINKGRMLELIKQSWPLILAGIVISIYMRIDQIMLKEMIGEASVGVYSAAVKISELWYFVPAAIINSVFPTIVRAKESGLETYYNRIQKVFDLIILVAYAVAIPVTFLADWIVSLLYGQRYLGAGDILNLHIWGGVFVCLGLARENWLVNEGLMKFSAITTSIGAVINVFLNWMLIPYSGGAGAAFATVIAQMFSAYLVGGIYPPTRKIFWQQTKALLMVNSIRKVGALLSRGQSN
jgi:PST family polysaccharide transporter